MKLRRFKVAQKPPEKRQRSKNLVYYCATGHYYKMAALSATSLRNSGYCGDIIILTNINTDESDKWETIKIDDLNGWFGRACIEKYVDINRWESLLYLDSDIVACKNIQPLFSNGPFTVVKETVKIKDALRVYGQSKNIVYFTKNELSRFGNENCINSGTFCVKTQCAPTYFKKWGAVYDSITDQKDDQGALSTALRREYLPFSYFDEKYVYCFGVSPCAFGNDTILVHFLATNDKYGDMKRFINNHFNL